jgi:hypothetical protein
MRYISPRRIIVLATLLLLLAPWASAAPRHGSTPPPRASVGIGIPDVLGLAWRLMTGGWMKEGCNVDPSGRCLPVVPIKTGCQIDPGGHCLSDPPTTPLTSADTGCHIDPSGSCIP